MRRSVYLVVFGILSMVAGFFYYSHTRESTALIATQDLRVGSRIEDSDVRVRSVNPASIGDDILRAPDQAVGQVVSFPILQGQFIGARQIASSRNANLLTSGLDVPPGYRIIGLPVVPAAAVGGALKPGDRVDVIAIPNPAKSVGLTEELAAAPVTIGKNVLVLGLRTEQGTQVDQAERALNLGNGKPASVLLAIAQTDEAAYSAAFSSSTFVLALSTD
jgi:Flp pilus assembly protein CpaB